MTGVQTCVLPISAGRFLLAPADASFVDAMRITTAIAAALAVVGAIAVSRWMPGKPRPTIEEIDEIVAREIAAAERELAMTARPQPSPAVASPGTVVEPVDG